jgi:hypothetical protein
MRIHLSSFVWPLAAILFCVCMGLCLEAEAWGQTVPGPSLPCTTANAIQDMQNGLACWGGVYQTLNFPPAQVYTLSVSFPQPTSPAVLYVTLPGACTNVGWGLLTAVDGNATVIVSPPSSTSSAQGTKRKKARH